MSKRKTKVDYDTKNIAADVYCSECEEDSVVSPYPEYCPQCGEKLEKGRT